jgi:hypothetical protein
MFQGFTAMSNFIYNSYCVVHPGAEQISLTAEYRPVQEAAAPCAVPHIFPLSGPWWP